MKSMEAAMFFTPKRSENVAAAMPGSVLNYLTNNIYYYMHTYTTPMHCLSTPASLPVPASPMFAEAKCVSPLSSAQSQPKKNGRKLQCGTKINED